VGKFERQALEEHELPTPSRFVICCSSPVKDVELSQEFLDLRQRLQHKRGIQRELRGPEAIGDKLKSAPDIVSEMFGDHAVAAHCGIDSWRPDMWAPLVVGALPDRLRSYEKASQTGTVWRDAEDENAWFTKLSDAILDTDVTVVCGASGAGKTFAVVAACESLSAWRGYYLHLPAETDTPAHAIAEGMLQRLSYPTLFVIDDVHGDFDKAVNVVDKLRRRLGDMRWRVISTAKRAGGNADDEERADNHDLLDRVKDEGGLFPLALNDAALCRFVLSQRPDWVSVRRNVLIALVNGFGRNLLLIREACEQLDSPLGMSQERVKRILRTARQTYFRDAPARSTWFRFAALATYDLDPLVEYFSRNEQADIERLKAIDVVWVYLQGHPVRYCAEHPAVAELLLQAVAVENDAMGSLTQQAGACLAGYCNWSHARGGLEALVQVLRTIMHTRPILIPAADDLALKAALLGDPALLDWWVLGARRYRLSLLSVALHVCAKDGARTADSLARAYADEVRSRLGHSPPRPASDAGLLATLGYGFRTLKMAAPEVYAGLLEPIQAESWTRLVMEGTLLDLLRLLENSTPEFSGRLIEALNGALLTAIFLNTEKAEHSLGTLALALRELSLHDARLKTRLLPDLEDKVGPRRWLDLMARGTLPDLLDLLRRSTPEFSGRLIEALDDALLTAIFLNTEKAGRSLGTLAVALRELGLHDARLKTRLLPDLEDKIGPRRWLDLMARGNLPDLLRLL
jgi:hypothetical protein